MAINPLNLNDTSPAAPAGKFNVKFQAAAPNADPSVVRDTSAYVPIMTNVAGGLVPTPPNDATKYLDGSGLFSIPASGGGSGAMTKIAEVVLGADGPTIAFNTIPGTYRNLKILLTGRSDDSTPDVYMQYNGDTGTNYDFAGGYHGSGNGDITGFGVAKALIANIAPTAAPAGCAGVSEITIFDYARTVWNKAARSVTHRMDGAGAGYVLMWGMTWLSTAAITDILLGKQAGAGNFKAGTVASLYGIS